MVPSATKRKKGRFQHIDFLLSLTEAIWLTFDSVSCFVGTRKGDIDNGTDRETR